MTITLAELLKDSAYKLTQFKPAQIQALEASVMMKDTGKTPAPYVNCLVRGKPIKLTPEEAIRQLYVMALKARQRAIALVDEATRAAEIAIEQDENAGMAYIESKYRRGIGAGEGDE